MQSTGASNAPTAITYTTSAWNASEWTLQPTSYIDPVYQITSPSTCTGSSYALAFKANADGTAKVYANGKLVDKSLAVKAGETLTRSYTVTRDTTFKVVFTPDKSYVIQNCAAYKNGYLMLSAAPVKKQPLQFPTVACDENGNLNFSNVAATIEAGKGNGFKMGGTNLPATTSCSTPPPTTTRAIYVISFCPEHSPSVFVFQVCMSLEYHACALPFE